jgi:hypothetical protein
MQYTPAQLVTLVEEARGHVHDILMGALWTKERYAKCVSFMERTDVVECGSSRKTLKPTTRSGGYVRPKLVKVDVPAPTAVTPKTVREVFGPSPREKAQDMISLGYKSQGGSVDSEVRELKNPNKYHFTESRDFLREVVKIIRSVQVGSK